MGTNSTMNDLALSQLKHVKTEITNTCFAVIKHLEDLQRLVADCKREEREVEHLIYWLDQEWPEWKLSLTSQDEDRIFGPEAMEEFAKIRSFAGVHVALAAP